MRLNSSERPLIRVFRRVCVIIYIENYIIMVMVFAGGSALYSLKF